MEERRSLDITLPVAAIVVSLDSASDSGVFSMERVEATLISVRLISADRAESSSSLV